MFRINNKYRCILSILGIFLICILVLLFTKFGSFIVDIYGIILVGDKINLEGDFNELKFIDDELKNYDLFLGGEAHGINMTYKMQEYMAKYFIENHGVKNIVLEVPVSIAEILNEYLKTGDETILTNALNKFKTTFIDNQETYDLYKFYYEYNKTLPESKKLNFVGIDVESVLNTTGIYINNLISNLGEPPEEIEEIVNRIKDYYNYHDRFRLKALCEDINNNSSYFKEYLGDKFFYFDLVINNIDFYGDMSMEDREKAMIRNFKAHYENLDGGKYFGQLGRTHVQKVFLNKYDSMEDKVATFAKAINEEDGPLNGKVYSMIYVYANSYSNHGGNITEFNDMTLPYAKDEGSVKVYSKKDYKKIIKILGNYGWSEEDLGDLVFIIKDSKATVNIGKKSIQQ